jgi:hypothetical protein
MRVLPSFNRKANANDDDQGMVSAPNMVLLTTMGDPFRKGGHNSPHSAYRALNNDQKVDFWTDATRLSEDTVIAMLKPLDPIDLTEMFKSQKWSNILHRMMAHACILAWSNVFDQFTAEDGPMVVRTASGQPTAVLRTEDQRKKLYYAAIKAVPIRYQRPGLLTIPITGVQAPNALRSNMLHDARHGRHCDLGFPGEGGCLKPCWGRVLVLSVRLSRIRSGQ